jgi:hypothetical protein
MGVIRYAANGTTPLDGDANGSEYAVLRNPDGDALGGDDSPLPVTPGLPPHPAAGGFYSVAGGLTAVIAASLASNTTLMAMRLDSVSSRKAYIERIRVLMSIVTVGTSALVPGILGLQRFSTATPTLGTARTPNKMNVPLASESDMTDIRDNNAALTVTSVVFGTLVAESRVPIVISGATSYLEWVFEPPYPVVLQPGDGLCLRTQSAMPATQTWLFDYNAYWHEG